MIRDGPVSLMYQISNKRHCIYYVISIGNGMNASAFGDLWARVMF